MKEINVVRKKIGQRWFRLAIEWSTTTPETKRERMEVVRRLHRNHGGNAKMIGGLEATHEAVVSAANMIRKSRECRWHRRYKEKGLPENHFRRSYWPRYKSVATTPKERLLNRVKSEVETHIFWCLNHPRRDNIYVEMSNDPAALGMRVEVGDCYPYRGSYKTYPAKEYYRTVTVPYRYLSRVYKHGLGRVGGMMTLDAAPVDSPERGIKVYAATWLVSGKSYGANVVQGYIALDDAGRNFHGKSITSAVSGLKRKARISRGDAKPARKILKKRVLEIKEKYGDMVFRFSDAEDLGFCEYGVKSWCNSVGIDYSGSATMAQIVDGYLNHPVSEARQFILHYGG